MFEQLRRIFGHAVPPHDPADLVDAVDDGIDLRAAIDAHERWKSRLDDVLAGRSSADLRPEAICFDDRCELGRWIHGKGKARLGALPGFTALLSDHKQFHYAASNVVALSRAGKVDQALVIMTGPYARASDGVLRALRDLLHIRETHKARSAPSRRRPVA